MKKFRGNNNNTTNEGSLSRNASLSDTKHYYTVSNTNSPVAQMRSRNVSIEALTQSIDSIKTLA